MNYENEAIKVAQEITECISDMTNNFSVGGAVLEAIEEEIASIVQAKLEEAGLVK